MSVFASAHVHCSARRQKLLECEHIFVAQSSYFVPAATNFLLHCSMPRYNSSLFWMSLLPCCYFLFIFSCGMLRVYSIGACVSFVLLCFFSGFGSWKESLRQDLKEFQWHTKEILQGLTVRLRLQNSWVLLAGSITRIFVLDENWLKVHVPDWGNPLLSGRQIWRHTIGSGSEICRIQLERLRFTARLFRSPLCGKSPKY